MYKMNGGLMDAEVAAVWQWTEWVHRQFSAAANHQKGAKAQGVIAFLEGYPQVVLIGAAVPTVPLPEAHRVELLRITQALYWDWHAEKSSRESEQAAAELRKIKAQYRPTPPQK